MEEIDLSVHNLVDFVLRSGDIDDRYFNNSTMQEGSKLHRLYQAKQGENYLSEVFLKRSFEYKNYLFNISGRCDGIIIEEPVIIDEIKSSNLKLTDFFRKNKNWHLGQAEIYGLIYLLNNNLETINLRLTYLSQVSSNILIKNYKYTKKRLFKRFYSYLDKYISFLEETNNFLEIKRNSFNNLIFPFDFYRQGQKNMIDLTYECIKNNDKYFFEASTGIGKTMSLFYGSLLGLRDSYLEKIFYLTAKNSGFQSILDALKILKKKSNLKIKSIQLTSKEKICLNKNENKACNPDDCIYAKDYYTKLFNVLIYALNKYDTFDQLSILEIAKKFEVCPFELSLDLSERCDLIICDFNYVYDPMVYLKRFFDAQERKVKSFLLVDEAHNLIDRSRNMYSASLNAETIKKSYFELLKLKNKKLTNLLLKVLDCLSNLSSVYKIEWTVELDSIDYNLITFLEKFKNSYRIFKKKNYLKKTNKSDVFLLEVLSFLKIFEYYDPKIYRINLDVSKENITLTLRCLDASNFLKNITNSLNGAVFFSGTFSPIDYYQKLILGDDSYKYFFFPSPFEKSNLKVLVNSKVSTKYKDRDLTLNEVIDEILLFIDQKIGNYLIYCPSFSYLDKLKLKIEADFKDDKKFVFQNREMTAEQKDDFLKNFIENPTHTTAGFCVLGGSFAEGIDLKNDRLIGTIIIGVGLPMINFENEQLRKYFDEICQKGYEYTYINPGINKVMQAVGRVIRSDEDRGVSLLIDSRYKNTTYRFLFEHFWTNNKFIYDKIMIPLEIKKFYE